MKNIKLYIYLFLGFFTVVSCNQKDIETFHGKHEIYFEKFYMNALAPGTEEADSTSTSFFFYPEGTPSIKVPLVVLLSGPALTSDLSFGLKVVEEGTTAHKDEYYLQDSYVFKARPLTEDMQDFRDTIEVDLKYSQHLEGQEKGLRLVVELVPNENVDLGQFERRRAIITWSKEIEKPDWWDYEVTYSLLGEWNPDKYRLFLEKVEGARELDGDMIKENPAQARSLVNNFKKWLTENLNDPDNGDKYKEILNSLI